MEHHRHEPGHTVQHSTVLTSTPEQPAAKTSTHKKKGGKKAIKLLRHAIYPVHVGNTSLCGGSFPSSIFTGRFAFPLTPLPPDVAGSSFGIFFDACMVLELPLAVSSGD
jgi:hypothetical protein